MCDTRAVKQEFSWKARCAKENKEFDAKVAASMGDYKDPGVSLNLAATNPNMTSDMTGASLGTVMREQAKLKGEFKAVMQLLTEKREQELRAKVLAENEVRLAYPVVLQRHGLTTDQCCG